jgi:hypothetical protein
VLLAMIRQAPGHLFFYTYAESFLGAAMLFLAVADHLLLTQTFHQGPHDAYA